MSSFIEDKPENPYAFIQWKGTDLCMDFHCKCGAQCHFDGYFAYVVQCRHCGTKWEMPAFVKPREVSTDDHEPHFLEPDEDYSDEVVDGDGVTQFIARPVKP